MKIGCGHANNKLSDLLLYLLRCPKINIDTWPCLWTNKLSKGIHGRWRVQWKCTHRMEECNGSVKFIAWKSGDPSGP